MTPESVFKGTPYALEKIGDFLRNSGSGALPGYASTAASEIITAIISALEKFDEKLRAAGAEPSEYGVALAGYAAMELKKLTDGEKGDIANNDCAEVFLRFLWYRINEMMEFEKEIDAEN